MSSETDRLKQEAEARRAEVRQTVDQIGERVNETSVFFVAGAASGALGLFLLNRIFFRRLRRLFRRRCCCGRK